MTKEMTLEQKYLALAQQHEQLEVDYSIVQQDLREALEALKELSDMYAFAWDRVDGGLMMMDSGVKRFEAAHKKATAVLVKHGRTV